LPVGRNISFRGRTDGPSNYRTTIGDDTFRPGYNPAVMTIGTITGQLTEETPTADCRAAITEPDYKLTFILIINFIRQGNAEEKQSKKEKKTTTSIGLQVKLKISFDFIIIIIIYL